MSTICGKDLNSLSQKSGVRTKLATKPKDGMANRLLICSYKHGAYNGSNHNIHKYV
jgi:hypothetical protein